MRMRTARASPGSAVWQTVQLSRVVVPAWSSLVASSDRSVQVADPGFPLLMQASKHGAAGSIWMRCVARAVEPRDHCHQIRSQAQWPADLAAAGGGGGGTHPHRRIALLRRG